MRRWTPNGGFRSLLLWGLLGSLLTVVAAHADDRTEDPTVLVVRAGEAIVTKKDAKFTVGKIDRPADERRLLEEYISAKVTPDDGKIAASASGKTVRFEASRDAVGKVYDVTIERGVLVQRLRRQNKKDVWVTLRREIDTVSTQLVVDFAPLATHRIAEEESRLILAPSGVRFLAAKVESSKRADAPLSERKLRLVGKKKGRTEVSLTYQIGPQKIRRKFRLEVTESIPQTSLSVVEGEAIEVRMNQIERRLRLRDAIAGELPPQDLSRHFRLEKRGQALFLVGLEAGEGSGVIRVVAKANSRKDQHPVVAAIELMIEVTPRP